MPLFSVLLNFCSTFTKVRGPLKQVTYVTSLNFKTYPFTLLLRRKPCLLFAFFCHFCCPMLLFQSLVACLNFTLTEPWVRHTTYNPPLLPVYVHFPIIFCIFSESLLFSTYISLAFTVNKVNHALIYP